MIWEECIYIPPGGLVYKKDLDKIKEQVSSGDVSLKYDELGYEMARAIGKQVHDKNLNSLHIQTNHCDFLTAYSLMNDLADIKSLKQLSIQFPNFTFNYKSTREGETHHPSEALDALKRRFPKQAQAREEQLAAREYPQQILSTQFDSLKRSLRNLFISSPPAPPSPRSHLKRD